MNAELKQLAPVGKRFGRSGAVAEPKCIVTNTWVMDKGDSLVIVLPKNKKTRTTKFSTIVAETGGGFADVGDGYALQLMLVHRKPQAAKAVNLTGFTPELLQKFTEFMASQTAGNTDPELE